MDSGKRVYKTKKKLSGVAATYRPWADWEEGDILIGTYKGSKTDQYDKPSWLFHVEDAYFKDKKLGVKLVGQMIGLNSNGKLDKAMADVEIGQMVQIEYKGMSPIEKGRYKGKEAHNLEVDLVEVDSGDSDEGENEDDDQL